MKLSSKILIVLLIILSVCAGFLFYETRPVEYDKSEVEGSFDLMEKIKESSFSIHDINNIQITEQELCMFATEHVNDDIIAKIIDRVGIDCEVYDVRYFLEDGYIRCIGTVSKGFLKSTATIDVSINAIDDKLMLKVIDIKLGHLSIPQTLIRNIFKSYKSEYIMEGGSFNYINFKNIDIDKDHLTISFTTDNELIIENISSEKVKRFSKEIIRILGESEKSVELSNELVDLFVKYKLGSVVTYEQIFDVIESYFKISFEQKLELIYAIRMLF